MRVDLLHQGTLKEAPNYLGRSYMSQRSRIQAEEEKLKN
jgi:hypothetical protein